MNLLIQKLGCKFEAILPAQYPEPCKNRKRSLYRSTVAQTAKELATELKYLQARNIVVMLGVAVRDIRNDGGLRADHRYLHPGIIISFDSKHGPLRVMFDGFLKPEDNLRAIAMHLYHLRAAALYGVGKDGQQYQGWKRIEDKRSQMSKVEAANYILDVVKNLGKPNPPEKRPMRGDAYILVNNPAEVCILFRDAAKLCHPDITGGDGEVFVQLQKAKEILLAQ